MFSCEFCEIFKNTFFYRTAPVTASRWIKCKPLYLKIIHLSKYISLCWWLGPGFRPISPESNISKWKYELKFLYSSLETEQKVSNRKLKIITDIHELRRKKFWSGTSSHVIKEIWRILVFKRQKSHTLQEKKIYFCLFITFLFTSNQ